VFLCSCYARNLLRFFLLVLGFLCFASDENFGLDAVYQLGYFYAMCCEYGDIDSYRC
jgi:hypothetical protein